MHPAANPSLTNLDALRSGGRVHIIGAGPVGLFLTALLQAMGGFSIRLYEKRPTYTRTRMVKLAKYLVADSIETYSEDFIDTDDAAAIFEPAELEEGLALRRSMPAELRALLTQWDQGFCPLNVIEQTLSNLIDARGSKDVERISVVVSAEEAMALLQAGDVLIDCSGCKSLLRDHLTTSPDAGSTDANTLNIQLEYAIVVTFLYGQHYECNEYCKYYKNAGNLHYKFIPAVDRTAFDGKISHVTGIVNITAADYEAMPVKFDGAWLRANFPNVSESMDRFIAEVKRETNGEIIGDLEIVRIPLNLYKARNLTNRMWLTSAAGHPFASSPVFLVGDAAMGSPYFQSISLGFECVVHLAGMLSERGLPLAELFDRYEAYAYKQWLRVYMRTKLIKHNKDLFEVIDEPFRLLDLLHIY